MAPRRGAAGAGYSPAPQYADDGDEPDDEWTGLSTMCCTPTTSGPGVDGGPDSEGAAPGWRHRHVGEGRGSYEKVYTYKYVGQGAGSFHKEEVVTYRPTTRLRSECVCLLVVAVILLLVVMWPRIVALWPGGAEEGVAQVLSPLVGGAPTNGSNATQMVEGSLVVDNLSYDDVAGDAALNDSLASAVEVAVASEATRVSQAETERSPPGHRQTIQPSQVTAVPVRGTNASVGVDFVIKALPLGHADAVAAGLSSTGVAASSLRSEIASHLRADATVQAAATGNVSVRAFTVYSHARQSSSTSTTAAPSFDCDVDYSECYECLRKSWSPAKLAWCCDHQARGCETTTTSVVYVCSEGYDNWRQGWSSVKKQFCCESQGLACETGNNASEAGGNTTSVTNSSGGNVSSDETGHAATGEGFQGAGSVNVSNASNATGSGSGLVAVGDVAGESDNVTIGRGSNATHASHSIHHVANKTTVTNA